MSTYDIPPEGVSDIDGWIQARLGRVTASRIGDATRQLKRGGWGKDRENYKHELIAERLTGRARDQYTSEAMIWGQQCEHDARLDYQKRMKCEVDIGGSWFVQHPGILAAGCSPDGLVGSEGMVQFKCPETATFVKVLLTKEMDEDYHAQCQWELACHPGRQWNDLVMFDPRIKNPQFRMIRWRIRRDDAWIATCEALVRALLKEIDEALAGILGAPENSGKIKANVPKLNVVFIGGSYVKR